MKKALLVERYSEALILSIEKSKMDEMITSIRNLDEIIKENEQLHRFLCDPIIEKAEKLELIKSIFLKLANINKNVENFIYLLIKEGRIDILDSVFEYLETRYNQIKGVIVANVQTPYPLSSELSSKIKKMLSKRTGKDIEIVQQIDKDMAGGVIISYENNIIDMSVEKHVRSIIQQNLS